MTGFKTFDSAAFEQKALQAADMLRALANERRLMILCKLVEWGEANVTQLAEAVGLSQSALSQHLAKMREEGILAFRRDAQTIWYRIADARTEELLATLHRLFCRPARKMKRGGKHHDLAQHRAARGQASHGRGRHSRGY